MTDRIYVDATVILSVLLGPEEPDHEGACALLGAANGGDFQLVLSALVMAEVVGVPNIRAKKFDQPSESRRKQTKARDYVNGLGGLYVELAEADGQMAADLSRAHDLDGTDALHLAAAMRHGCKTFFTSDHGLLKVNGKVPGMEVRRPDWTRAQLDFNAANE